MSDIKSLDHTMLRTWLNNKEVFAVDVREPNEYQIAHIAGTVNIPLSILGNEIYAISEHDHKKIVMICQAGVRSMKACLMLQQVRNNSDIWNLEGGINQWHMNKLPLIKFE